jgi:hypothetical protein
VRRVAAFAPGVVAGVACWLFYNFTRFGNPFETGYLHDTTPGFGSPVVSGLLALIASPSASVFLYSPVAIGGVAGLVLIARRDRSASILLGSLIILFALAYASLANWLGGRSYGSRYLIVVLPYLGVGWAELLAQCSEEIRRLMFAAALSIGVLVQLPGVLVDYAKVSQDAAAHAPRTTEMRQWDWSASGLVMNTRAAIEALPANVEYVAGRRSPPVVARTASQDDRSFSQQFSFSLDFWWLYLFYMGKLPRLAVFCVALTCAAIAGMLAVQLAHEIRHTG